MFCSDRITAPSACLPAEGASAIKGYYSFEVGFEMSSPFLLQILILIPVVLKKTVTIFESSRDSH